MQSTVADAGETNGSDAQAELTNWWRANVSGQGLEMV